MELYEQVIGSEVFQAVRRALAGPDASRQIALSGCWGASSGLLIAAIAQETAAPVLVAVAGIEEADGAEEDLAAFGVRGLLRFPAFDVLPEETDSPARDILSERTDVLRRLFAPPVSSSRGGPQSLRPLCVVASVQALLQRVPERKQIERSERIFAVGGTLDLRETVEWFHEHGYVRMAAVGSRGEFAVRGGILDVFPFRSAEGEWDTQPVRIELSGDRIESVRTFDVASQLSRDEIPGASVRGLPSGEEETWADESAFALTLFDYLPGEAVAVVYEPEEFSARAKQYAKMVGRRKEVIEPGEMLRRLYGLQTVTVSASAEGEGRNEAVAGEGSSSGVRFEYGVRSVQRFEGPSAADAIAKLAGTGTRTVVFCETGGEGTRVKRLLVEEGGVGPAAVSPAGRPAPRVDFRMGRISAGFEFPEIGLIVLSTRELFHRRRERRRSAPRIRGLPVETFRDLAPGDYVVHVTHGIARYLGLRTLERDGRLTDYLELKFAEGAKLYVPATHIELVEKYIGPTGERPALSRIGSDAWLRKARRAEESSRDLAAELIELHAARTASPGIVIPPDGEWQEWFEASFSFEETPDQLDAVIAAKADLEKASPMDRLLCGDVGFGKTEVAVRLVFKTVSAGRQAAVLVPTTLLAEQHGQTFRERFSEYPIEVEVLSRFRSKDDQRRITEGLAAGTVDVVIGTHRLIQKDVSFKDLGLIIIDEEQRFGVRDKERLKKLRTSVNVMTMTATPIPRTLHMTLMGLRDISSLETPPADRLAIRTKVCRFDSGLIRRVILRELAREGQIFFVHNRVRDIELVRRELARLVPEARIIVCHGQLHERTLAERMRAFLDREADLLLTTTIIESGIDIPNTNTLIVHEADMFGLAELHQLRGRVGRSRRRAYCYLLLPETRPVTREAARRLKALEEFTELGSGFQLAMRDLEIRGAGNVLGIKQSGHIAEVGYEMYCRLLEHAIKQMLGQSVEEPMEVTLDLGVDGYLPDDYITDPQLKLTLYKKLASVRTQEELEAFETELRDRFGWLPEETSSLMRISRLRVLGRKARVPYVGIDGRMAVFKLHKWDFAKLEPRLAHIRDDIRVVDEETFMVPLESTSGNAQHTMDQVRDVLLLLQQ